MGWGRGGRGQGQGRGPRLVSPRPTSPRPASPSSSHYFEEAADETTNQDGSDQIARLEKKLADIKEIEERLKRGETPSISQIKKVESKAAVEKELAQLRGHSEDVDTQLAELLKEKAELEAEQAAEKEGAGQSCFLPHVVPEMASPSSRAKLVPGQPPRSPTRLAPWAKQEKPRSKSPAVTEPAMKAADLPTPTSKEQSAAPSSTPPRSRATSPRPEGELTLPLPARVQDWQIRQLREDLCFWSEKYASAARVDPSAVVVQLSAEAHAGGAKAELFALMEYDLELEQGTLSRGIVSISGSPKATGKTINDDLSDVDVVFECCDTDASGELDLHEVKFALNAFGLFPSLDYLRDWMGDCQTLDRTAFRNLLDQKRRSAPTSMRRPRTVPYARRGVRMQQLNDLQHTFLSSGWLKSKCDAFNAENKKAIDAGSCFAMDTNLYALNRWVIMPGTSPSVAEPLPPALRRSAGMPDALHESSYSELMNSGGLAVDYFVSHFWGHPFQDTWSALDLWSQQVHWQIGKEPPDMVYWVCLLALNQHQPGEEVGGSPEEGPFNAALMQSGCGAVMVVDEDVSPFSRIWCLFEVKRLTDLKKDFHLISSCGAMGSNLQMVAEDEKRQMLLDFTRRVADALSHVSAFEAKSSSADDKFAIWHRVADPHMRKIPLAIARERKLFNPNSFKRFDTTIRSLLAAPLFQTSLQEEDAASALRYIGLGAPFGEMELEKLSEEWNVDVCKEQVQVQSGTRLVPWHLLHCAAYFGHEESVESLVRRKAKLEVKTSFGLTPLHQAARNGHTHVCEMLLNMKANINAITRDSRTAMQNAAHQGHREVVELLAKRGADINHKDANGITALHSSSVAGYDDIVKVLIRFRADCMARNGEDLTPLHLASRSGFVEVAKEVLESSPENHVRRSMAGAVSRKGSALDMAATAEMADFLRSVTEG